MLYNYIPWIFDMKSAQFSEISRGDPRVHPECGQSRGWAKRENESSGYFNKFLNPFWFLNTPGAKLSLFCKHSFIDESYLLLFSWQVSFQNILYNLK